MNAATLFAASARAHKMRDVLVSILKAFEQEQSVVRITIMKSSGSTPRTAGACMAVFEDGSMVGTIGGGSVEHASHMAAKEMSPGQTQIRDFDLTNNDAASLGMVCGGAMTVLLDSLLPTNDNNALIQELVAQYASSEPRLLATSFTTDGTVVCREILPFDDNRYDSTRAPFLKEDGKTTVLFEPLLTPETVHFIGGGHVAQATAKLAAFTEFRVVVVDDREDFANPERFPDAAEIRVTENFKDCIPAQLGPEDYVVIMTRGHLHDKDVLAQALKTNAGYIGMIGSKKKKAATYDSLLKDEFTQTDLDQVHCPIGLSINADTPQEIAVSIIGELIATRAKRKL